MLYNHIEQDNYRNRKAGENGRFCVKKYCRHRTVHVFYPLRYSNISPGWQSRALHMAINVDTLIAFALPVFKIDIFARVMPTFSASWVTLIFRLASITSILNIKVPLISSMSVPSLYSQVAFVLQDSCFFKKSRKSSHAYPESNTYNAYKCRCQNDGRVTEIKRLEHNTGAE